MPEVTVVVGLFAFSCFEFLRVFARGGGSLESRAAASVVFLLLAGAYLGLSLEPVRRALRRFISRGPVHRMAAPASLLAAVIVSSLGARSTAIPLVASYVVYRT